MLNSFFSLQKTWMPKQATLYQIKALILLSLLTSIMLFLFATFRIYQGNITLGIAELIATVFYLFSAILLHKKEKFYYLLATIFFVLSYVLLILIFLYLPNSSTPLHWIPTVLVFVFFLLGYRGGVFFLFLYLIFIVYLMLTTSVFSAIEYITWTSSLVILSIIMFFYEKVKHSESKSLKQKALELKTEVNKQTKKLKDLNDTLERRVEEELKKRQEQEQMLLKQYRMANIGSMLDSIAHQWRQPLMHINSILMNMNMALEKQNPDKNYLPDKINKISVLTGHMSQTIEDFRGLFSPNSKPSEFIINIAVTEVLYLMKNSLSSIDVRHNLPINLKIVSHKNEFIQVLITLLSNATEALEKQNISKPVIIINSSVTNEHFSFSVEDNAGGIDNKNITKIFDPYFTTKDQSGGTGLGLYISKIIVEHKMHGKISAHNTNNGAIFTIISPKKT